MCNEIAPDLLARAILVDSEPRVVRSVFESQRLLSANARRRVAARAVAAAESAATNESEG